MISYWTMGTGWVMGPLDERGNEGGGAGSRGLGLGGAQEGQVMSSNVASELRCWGDMALRWWHPRHPHPLIPAGSTVKPPEMLSQSRIYDPMP